MDTRNCFEIMELLKFPQQELIEIFRQIRRKINLDEVAIEKDVWVTTVLRALFALPYSDQLSFKGGTSLSKCWKVIERFSEDVDIAINREFFGFEGDSFTVKQISKNLRKATCQFCRNTLQYDLQKQLIANGIPENQFSVTVQITDVTTVDPEKIFVEYKSIFNTNPYVKNVVVLEVSGRSMRESLQETEIQSFVDEYFSQAIFAEKPFQIKAVAPERTFLEKICLLHEEFSKPQNLVRTERMSRHLYDLQRMIDTHIANRALADKELYQSVIAHRRRFISIKDFDYDTLAPATICIIPPESVIEQWKTDYETMQQTMIYGTSLPFSDLVERIKELNNRINMITWE